MRDRLRAFLARHEPHPGSWLVSAKSGLGALAGIAGAAWLASWTELPLLLAPFGATAVLVFGHPQSPLAQPANVLGGYLVGMLAGLGALSFLPEGFWVAPVGVGLAIAVMMALRLTHPPAGAIPIITATAQITAGTLVEAVVAGSIGFVALAAVHHRLPPRLDYPRRKAG